MDVNLIDAIGKDALTEFSIGFMLYISSLLVEIIMKLIMKNILISHKLRVKSTDTRFEKIDTQTCENDTFACEIKRFV
jgi:hypothetical protein